MSRPNTVDMRGLRERLLKSLGAFCGDGSDGECSLYLATLGCAYLACDKDSPLEERVLDALYTSQAQTENIDSDELLTRLIMLSKEGGADAES